MKHNIENRSKLLISIRNVAELPIAVEGGADWIDLKEPRHGALAAVTFEVASAVVSELGGRLPLSAALGELVDWEQSPAQQLLGIDGIEVVKLGLAGCHQIDDWTLRWRDAFRLVQQQEKQLAAVVYADWQRAKSPAPSLVIELARDCRSKYLLIDTYIKDGRWSFDFFTEQQLCKILKLANSANLKVVLAGSINFDHLGEIATDLVDIVAVRGAVCRGNRATELSVELVGEFRRSLNYVYDVQQQTTADCPSFHP